MLERSILVFFTLLLSLSILNMMVTTTVDVVEQEEIKISNPINVKHLKCLATGIYYEAAGEPTVGQIAVARVIMNRVLHGFAKDPCAVVYQHTIAKDEDGMATKLCQFSWVCEGKTTPSENNPRFAKAIDIATQILAEDKWNDLIPNNTFFFHNMTVAPRWTYNKVVTIGNHIFYSKGREKNITIATTDK
jgi:spore germination cell wall hydrolase CwlJ-like protein